MTLFWSKIGGYAQIDPFWPFSYTPNYPLSPLVWVMSKVSFQVAKSGSQTGVFCIQRYHYSRKSVFGVFGPRFFLGPFWALLDPWGGPNGPPGGWSFLPLDLSNGFLDHFVESISGSFTRIGPTDHRFGLIWKNWSFSRIYTIGIGGYPQPGEKSTLFSLQR